MKGTALLIVCLSAGRIKAVWKPWDRFSDGLWCFWDSTTACVPHTPYTRCSVSHDLRQSVYLKARIRFRLEKIRFLKPTAFGMAADFVGYKYPTYGWLKTRETSFQTTSDGFWISTTACVRYARGFGWGRSGSWIRRFLRWQTFVGYKYLTLFTIYKVYYL